MSNTRQPKENDMTDEPAYIIAAAGTTPARISKPSVGKDDEITIVYPDVTSDGPRQAVDRVPRREVCARLDGFPEVEILRTERRVRLVTILNAGMLTQWLRTRPGGWDGRIADLGGYQ